MIILMMIITIIMLMIVLIMIVITTVGHFLLDLLQFAPKDDPVHAAADDPG